MNLVDRFLNYVKFDTQSDELTNMTPSTPGRWCSPNTCATNSLKWVFPT